MAWWVIAAMVIGYLIVGILCARYFGATWGDIGSVAFTAVYWLFVALVAPRIFSHLIADDTMAWGAWLLFDIVAAFGWYWVRHHRRKGR